MGGHAHTQHVHGADGRSVALNTGFLVIAARAAEPWHAEAVTAHRHMMTADTFAEAAPYRFAFEPLMYGRWDDAARAPAAADPAQRSLPVSEHC